MATTLEYYIDILKHTSADEFVDELMYMEKEYSTLSVFNAITGGVTEKKVPYETYMKEIWGSEDDSVEKCIERSRISKMRDYAEIIENYTGFVENGKVFFLNKEEKFVSMLCHNFEYEGVKKSHLITHYNPLDVDCIEQTVASDYLFRQIDLNKYDASTDEKKMIKECDKLIGKK